jgi:uncharacterized protein YijF (DUF1287 family)
LPIVDLRFIPLQFMKSSSPGASLRRFRVVLLFAVFLAAPWSRAGLKTLELITSARAQIGVTVSYDAAYRVLEYPGGDVPKETGVCTDVVVRALREQSFDLQKEMHEDMKREFSAYPRRWGLKKPDRNIDHRRVPNMMTYFRRQGWSVPVTKKAEDYAAGDLVTWDLGGDLPHIGIISDRRTPEGVPLVIHNIGRGTQEEDILFSYTITGHYRAK